jgi:hypothetical protein
MRSAQLVDAARLWRMPGLVAAGATGVAVGLAGLPETFVILSAIVYVAVVQQGLP